MKLIVGLGNPGEKYKNTRHNVGFIVVDAFKDKLISEKEPRKVHAGDWNYEKKFTAEIFKFDGYLLAKPQTFMNESGDAVAKLVKYFAVGLDDLIVVHDDVDMEFGKTRFRKGMGSGGHHGIEDIIQKLGSKEFYRLRIGIGRPDNNKFDVEDYVLGELSAAELENVKKLSHLLV